MPASENQRTGVHTGGRGCGALAVTLEYNTGNGHLNAGQAQLYALALGAGMVDGGGRLYFPYSPGARGNCEVARITETVGRSPLAINSGGMHGQFQGTCGQDVRGMHGECRGIPGGMHVDGLADGWVGRWVGK